MPLRQYKPSPLVYFIAFLLWLQGTALASLQTFFQTLVASKANSASFEALLSALLAAGHDRQVGKTAQHNIAQCIAVLCTTAGPAQTSTTVKSLLSAVEGNDEVASRLALFSLGEIGRCTDLSKFKQLQVCAKPTLQAVAAFSLFVRITQHCDSKIAKRWGSSRTHAGLQWQLPCLVHSDHACSVVVVGP